MRAGLLKLIGAMTVALALMFAAPQLSRSQQRDQVTETRVRTPPDPEDRRLPPPGEGRFSYAGGNDAGADASPAEDAGADGGNARPPPPLDDASCQVAGGGEMAALLGFLFAAGLLFRRRE